MTAFNVTPPYQFFIDSDGTALENGKLYIGIENQDPEVNPIAVFWDEAMNIPASQPIRTLDGVPVYQGSPGNLFAPTNFSTTVKNKKDIIIYYSPSNGVVGVLENITNEVNDLLDNIGTGTGAGLVGWIQEGSGAVATTLLKKGRWTLSAFDFMTPEQIDDVLTGAPLMDVRPALSNAIAAASANNKTLYIPEGTYLMNSTSDPNACLILPSNIKIIGDNVKLKVGSGLLKNIFGVLISDTTQAEGVQNVQVEGITVDGNRVNRSGGTQVGSGFYIASSRDIRLVNCGSYNSTADGIQIVGDLTATGGLSDNVILHNFTSVNNYRNGLFLSGTVGFRCYGGVFRDTSGGGAQAGILSQPDDANSPNLDFTFFAPRCTGNQGNGFLIANEPNGSTGNIFALYAANNTLYGFNNPTSGFYTKLIGFYGSGNSLGNFQPQSFDVVSQCVARAIVSFQATTTPPTIINKLGISTVTKVSTGVYEITITPSQSSNNYLVMANATEVSGPVSVNTGLTRTNSTFRIKCQSAAGGGSVVDPDIVDIVIFYNAFP